MYVTYCMRFKITLQHRTQGPCWTDSSWYGRTGQWKAVRGKEKVFVTDRWCKSGHITITEQPCCRDIEVLAVSMRPPYLPPGFVLSRWLRISPPLLTLMQPVMSCTLWWAGCRHNTHRLSSSSLGTFIRPLDPPLCPPSPSTSHATPETIKHWTFFYANTKEAYAVTQHPSPLGSSDQNLFHILPRQTFWTGASWTASRPMRGKKMKKWWLISVSADTPPPPTQMTGWKECRVQSFCTSFRYTVFKLVS